MQKNPKFQVDKYLGLLEQRLNGPLFSEEQMPGIRKAVRIPTFRRDEIQSEKDFLDLVEGLKADTKTWIHENQFQKIRLECIRKAVATLGNKHLTKLWNHESLKIDDQEKLKNLIDKKLKHSRRYITIVRAAITTLLWIIFGIFCALLLGGPLFAIKYFYATIKEGSLDAHAFLDTDFDTKAKVEFETQLGPYIREINAAKNKLDADKNLVADNRQNILATNRNVMQTHIFPLLEGKDYKALSVASRLLRNIIYTDPNKRYYHTPTPTVSKLPAKRILISWPDANLVKKTDNLTLGTITYTIEGTDGSTGIFSIKPMYETQAGKISDTHFWIYDSRNLLVVNRKTGEQQEVLNKELKKQVRNSSLDIEIIGVAEKTNDLYFTSKEHSGANIKYYRYNLDNKALDAISDKNLIGTELIIPSGKNMTFCRIWTHGALTNTGHITITRFGTIGSWDKEYILPLMAPEYTGEPLFLKDGRFILNTKQGVILFNPIDPNNTITINLQAFIFPMSITTLAKPETRFEIGEAKGKEKERKDNTILFTTSKDESIATILYFKKNPDSTNLELTLQICSLAPVKTLNTINVEWDLDKDGDPTKIYFDEKNNICIEGQNKLITYPYGDQAEVYEVDRKTCLGIS